MNASIRSIGSRELAVALSALVCAACSSSPKVSPEGRFPIPVAEHPIFVTLPGRGLADAPLREQYRKSGRRAIGHIRARCVTTPTLASPCRQTVDVRITAVEGAKFIDPAKPPPHPQLLAWVENLGNRATYDGFEPATQFVYALVVDAAPVGDTDGAPAIYRVGFSTDPAKSRITQEVYGHVYRCHTYPPPLFSEADFQACYGHAPYANRTERATFSALVTALSTWSWFTGSGDPTWFSCSTGCCTASAVQAANAM
jgi:hypothetical protein